MNDGQKEVFNVRQATRKGRTLRILVISLILVILIIGGSYFFLGSQDREEATEGVIIDPESETSD